MPLTHETLAQLRATHDRKFIEELYSIGNSLHDMTDPTLSFIGDKICELAGRADFLGARSPEDYLDRETAARDAYNDARESNHYRDVR